MLGAESPNIGIFWLSSSINQVWSPPAPRDPKSLHLLSRIWGFPLNSQFKSGWKQHTALLKGKKNNSFHQTLYNHFGNEKLRMLMFSLFRCKFPSATSQAASFNKWCCFKRRVNWKRRRWDFMRGTFWPSHPNIPSQPRPYKCAPPRPQTAPSYRRAQRKVTHC